MLEENQGKWKWIFYWSSIFALPKANRLIHCIMHGVNIEQRLDENY